MPSKIIIFKTYFHIFYWCKIVNICILYEKLKKKLLVFKSPFYIIFMWNIFSFPVSRWLSLEKGEMWFFSHSGPFCTYVVHCITRVYLNICKMDLVVVDLIQECKGGPGVLSIVLLWCRSPPGSLQRTEHALKPAVQREGREVEK